MSRELKKFDSVLKLPHNPSLFPEMQFKALYERVLSGHVKMLQSVQVEKNVEQQILESPVPTVSASIKTEKSKIKTKPQKTSLLKARTWETLGSIKMTSNKVVDEQPDVNIKRINLEELKFEDESSQEQLEDAATENQFFKFFSNLQNRILKESDLKPVLDLAENDLIAKNVASSISKSICRDVLKSLEGKSLSSFKSISNVVKNSMTHTLTTILTPTHPVDILHSLEIAKSEFRPLTIVFTGVNGVGKSTSLAKICAWLLKQKHKILIAACDTFRSGAVEQLKKHAQILGDVALYEQGYNKNSSDVAKKAIERARSEKFDIVLIDTAGRMQTNAPLMQALATLVKVNNPDIILFVGEAVVGNDSIEQLNKFNDSLKRMTDPTKPREIDGIVLTKFDMVDNKVGAAVSMTYTTGKPIVFVGNGQTYSDLRTFSVKKIVDMITK